ncbi:MAG: cadmium-translocating P-type ATPase [Bacilli bacterium]|nr:cadmium-translocating P-type ATPase [Bacilli bacterium]
MSKKLKKRLIRIIISLVVFIPLFVVDLLIGLDSFIDDPKISWLIPFLSFLLIYLFISYDILIKAFKNIIHGQIFDENFLMIIATIGAFCIQEFPEAVAVMLLYQIGEFFQDLAVGKSRKSIAELMDIRPDFASLVKDNGEIEVVDPELIEIGNIIRVKPGERIPLDGVIVSGDSSLDMKALTGESLPVDVEKGNEVLSGAINLTSTIDIKVSKTFSDSTVNKILELVENASNVKSKQENFITKFAKYYTPIVVISAILLVVIGWAINGHIEVWVARALNFLVVSCPCAIVISVPLSFFASIGKAAKLGILIKGSLYLENFNKAKTFVFDKTGTLTKGNFVVKSIVPEDKKEEILKNAYICENQSSHPIALSIKAMYQGKEDLDYKITNVPGKGVIAKKDKDTIYCGNHKLLDEYGFNYPLIDEAGTVVYVCKNKDYLGYILIKDEIKEDAYELISYFNKQNIKTIMLTGDNEKCAKEVQEALKLSSYKSSLLPQEKVSEIEQIFINKEKNELIAYVGDGINDAPTLARADIGISMGGVGSDAAIEASDIVLMHDNLSSLLKAKQIAKKTIRIVKENIWFAILVKVAILILSAFGIANIWIAIFGDVGVALLCVLNALRCGRVKKE